MKSHLSYKQILSENIECLKQRLISSQNPFLNEFNLIYKDIVNRLDIFEQITNGVIIKPPQSSQTAEKISGNVSATDAYDSELTNNEFDTEFIGYNNMS